MSCDVICSALVLFFKPKTAYEMRISDWSSDVCSADLWSIVWGGKGNQWANGSNFGYPPGVRVAVPLSDEHLAHTGPTTWSLEQEIGRESCRERGCHYV